MTRHKRRYVVRKAGKVIRPVLNFLSNGKADQVDIASRQGSVAPSTTTTTTTPLPSPATNTTAPFSWLSGYTHNYKYGELFLERNKIGFGLFKCLPYLSVDHRILSFQRSADEHVQPAEPAAVVRQHVGRPRHRGQPQQDGPARPHRLASRHGDIHPAVFIQQIFIGNKTHESQTFQQKRRSEEREGLCEISVNLISTLLLLDREHKAR